MNLCNIYIRNRISILLIIFSFFIFPSLFAELKLSLRPTPVIAGEPATITIQSTDGKAIIKNFPEIPDVTWMQDNNAYKSGQLIINGKRYDTTEYSLVVSRPGLIEIPSIEIHTNTGKTSTEETQVRVVEGPLTDIDSQLFIEPVYDIADINKIYIGEELPLKIELYQVESLNVSPAEYPQVELSNVVFYDFSKYNRQNNKFAPYPYENPVKVNKDGIYLVKTVFYTSLRPLGAGNLNGIVSLLTEITVPKKNSSRNRGDDMFSAFLNDDFMRSSFFNRNSERISKILTAKLPKINVKPLPPIEDDSKFLGLVGDWNVKAKLPTEDVEEGDALTLSLTIKGNGTLETLDAPELEIPGFNIYSPEIKKTPANISNSRDLSEAIINYVLVPIESGKTNIDLSFSTFNVTKENYETVSIKKSLDIKPSKNATKGAVFGDEYRSSYKETISKKTGKSKVSNVILYLKNDTGVDIKIPLWKNVIIPVFILIFLGPLLWGLTEFFRFRKNKLGGNLKLRRKAGALKRKTSVIKSLSKASSKTLPNIIQNELVPFINDLKGFPPGTTADELINKLDDKELAKVIKEAGSLAYMPGTKSETSTLQNKLLKLMKRLSIVLIFFSAISITYNSGYAETKNTQPGTPELELSDLNRHSAPVNELISAYNNADFEKAKEICLENIHPNSPNPNWLYNLGNCYFQLGDLAQALVSYERALRLSPRDSDIIENLNYVRRKLFLPEINQTKTPSDILKKIRNSFRSDEWLFIMSIAWFLIFVSLILKRFTPGRIWLTILSIAGAVTILSIVLITCERASIYNDKTAIVVVQNPKTFSLPSSNSSEAGMNLSTGETVYIEERMKDWIRIRAGKTEGWVKKDIIEPVWPYK